MLNTGSWAGKVEAEQAVNPLNDGAMGTATETEGSTAVDSPTPVVWEKPIHGEITLNSDGSLTSTKAGIGGVFRNHQGQATLAYSSSNNSSSILFLETMAILTGLDITLKQGHKCLLLQVDSLQAHKIIQGLQQPTWRVKSIVTKIKDLMSELC
ncbi:hypothetical protein FRX31_007926 [Thalictrum thalictroides]|uniref:RNase H type-1 domain-containing protein n=1 Tax=Thalictrum thalictroides TaxID=46969 RepID=A0A7J6X0D8_THATH|nr:hypothetical protein FRX31_007926 [Thalictrum thalictroides]